MLTDSDASKPPIICTHRRRSNPHQSLDTLRLPRRIRVHQRHIDVLLTKPSPSAQISEKEIVHLRGVSSSLAL
jgi:hypothetical protein